ncbi:MAG: hypothetical protein GY719_03955 [bacterium]|nr:hypothetical protein [bacterium]
MKRPSSSLITLLLLTASAGAEPIRLTSNPADDRYPMFSPGGERILFESDRDGNWEIYAMAATGRRAERLTDDPADDRFAAWSPDGDRIVFQSDRRGGQKLFVLAGC